MNVAAIRPKANATLPIGEWLAVDAVLPWDRNPRLNDAAVPRVADSIRRFGFVSPIVIWASKKRMVAGHTRLKAIRFLLAQDSSFVPSGAPGPGLVPVRFHEFANEAEANLYALADNKLGEIAEWDEDRLLEIVGPLAAEERLVIGFEEWEPPKGEPPSGDDIVPEPPKVAITQPGDIWLLDDCRLLCGDSTKLEDIARLAGGAPADLLWTDPPYNVSYVGKTKEALTIVNDEMTAEQFRAFLVGAFAAASAQMKAGAVFYIAHADSEGFNFRGAVQDVGWKLAECLIWVKDQFVMGRQDYHWRHEPILYGWKLGAAHLALEDRTQDTVWEFARPRTSLEHPTMKPPELIERAIVNSTKRGELVLDSFGGSGSTLVAAVKQERRAMLCEIDPRYCDVIVERWQRLTGKKATLARR